MKKFILTCLVICFTCIAANAEQIFFTAGRPTHTMNGRGYVRSINNFGSNAAFSPEQTARAAQRIRRHQREDAINRAISNFGQYNNMNNRPILNNPMTNRNTIASQRTEVSRFDKNYTVPNRKSYTKNGITYYN
ncbi:hypothetical protein HDR58_10375 [bacterium]|nr:hypothetical protein [bacterium]